MKTAELCARVRHAVMIEGIGEGAAAERFGINARTVSRMAMFSVPPGYVRKRPPLRPKLDGFTGILDAIWMADRDILLSPLRGYLRRPDDVKTRIVAKSLQPGVRIADVANLQGVASHQLSEWRRQARWSLLVLPAEMMADIVAGREPAFVPVLVTAEEKARRLLSGAFQLNSAAA